MTQVFRPHANLVARGLLLGGIAAIAGIATAAAVWVRSDDATGVGRTVEQPIPFSHKHHVGGLGIDCRYCHTSVAESSVAGLPPSETCMTCHSQLWTRAPMLEGVRASLRTNQPIRWRRVHDLPDFVYFDHSVHVSNGVGCESCHGRIDRMPLTAQAEPLTMGWCLDCHRQPARHLRPPDRVFDMGWAPPPGERRALEQRLVGRYDIHTERLTDCSVCHR